MKRVDLKSVLSWSWAGMVAKLGYGKIVKLILVFVSG